MATHTYWMHGFGGDDPKATAQALREAGFDVVVAGGEAVIDAVNEAGMRSWLCGGAFGLGDLKDDDTHKAVDVTGTPRIWFGSGCPNSPVLRERNLKAYAGMAGTPGIEGILVDGCRFASPASGLYPFLTCFCGTCRDKAARLGFDFDAMQRDVKTLHAVLTGEGAAGSRRCPDWAMTPIGVVEWLTDHPGVLEWLRFRRTCTTEHFRAIGEIIHGAKIDMGVYIFTPSLSPFVGQSYVDLREFVDVFAPMIYRNYPKHRGEACLNWELTIISEELDVAGAPTEEQAMEAALSWTGLSEVVPDRTIEGVRAGLPPAAVGHETALARSLIGKERRLIPIVWIDDPLMEKTGELVRTNGANGIDFFVFQENWGKLAGPGIVK